MLAKLTPIAAFGLGACATIVDGTTQDIHLSSNVPTAKCSIEQNGVQIVDPTPVPATLKLPRRRGNLIVTCSAPDHETGTQALVAGTNPKSVALMLPMALLDAAADSALGGLVEYQDRAYVYLMPSHSS